MQHILLLFTLLSCIPSHYVQSARCHRGIKHERRTTPVLSVGDSHPARNKNKCVSSFALRIQHIYSIAETPINAKILTITDQTAPVDAPEAAVVVLGASVVVVVVGFVSSVHMLPPYATIAAILVPSADIVIPDHFFVAPMEVSSVHVTPLLLEVHMLP